MAVPRQTGPTGLRLTAIILAIGGLMIGIGVPVLLSVMNIATVEIARGVDLMLLICPAVGIVDLLWARFFWRRADATDPRSSGPIA